MKCRRGSFLSLLSSIASGALAFFALPLAAQPPIVLVRGPVFPIDSPRPGGQVVGQPLTVKAPGISRILIVWTRGSADGAAHAIWAREIEEGSPTHALTPERVLARAPGKAILDVSLSASWDRYALAWKTFDPALRRTEMFVRLFDVFLRPLGPPINIAIDTTEPPGQVFLTDGPRAGLDDSGRLVVAWLEEIDLFGLGRADLTWMRVQRFAVDGSLESDLRWGSTEGSRALALAVAPGGSFLVAWEDYDPDVATVTRARLYGPNDATPPVNLDPGQDTGFCWHSSRSPAVAANYDSFFLAFADPLGRRVQGGGTDPLCFGLFGQAYNLSGAHLRGEFRIKRNSWAPLVQANRSQFLVTWEGNPPPPPGGARQPGAYAHPFRDDGQSAGPDLFIQRTPVSGVAFYGDSAVLVWADHGVKARELRGHP